MTPLKLGVLVADMRHVHDVHGLELGELLVGLLLAIAGVLANHKVGALDVGAHATQLEAHEALDERAGVARHVPLGILGRPLGTSAEANLHGARGSHDLLGHVEAEAADDLLGVALAAAVHHLADAAGVQVCGNAVQVGRGRRSVLLREKHGLVHLAHNAQKAIVRLDVHAQITPHFVVVVLVCHGDSSPASTHGRRPHVQAEPCERPT